MKIKTKSMGPSEALQIFRAFLDEHFLCFSSDLKPSDQGGYHFFSTIQIDEGWRLKPATPKQFMLLLELGLSHRVNEELTRGEASDLIQDQLNRRAIG